MSDPQSAAQDVHSRISLMSQSSQTHIFFEFDKIVAQEDQKIIVCFVSIFLAKYLRHSSTYLVATLKLHKIGRFITLQKVISSRKRISLLWQSKATTI